METDPNKYADLGKSPEHKRIIALMYKRLGEWARRLSQRTTKSDAEIVAERGQSATREITLGIFDEEDFPAPLTQFYRGKPRPEPTS